MVSTGPVEIINSRQLHERRLIILLVYMFNRRIGLISQ